jgi:hypothetical protein
MMHAKSRRPLNRLVEEGRRRHNHDSDDDNSVATSANSDSEELSDKAERALHRIKTGRHVRVARRSLVVAAA